MAEEISLKETINFFERQLDALNATKKFKYVLYGGSVGSGKSYFLRWTLLYWLIRWHAELNLTGIRVGLFCEDYPALNDRHLSKIKAEFPDWLGSYNEQRHEFTLHPAYGAGVLAFRNLDDPSRYLSVEFAAEAVDELNRNPKSTFDILRTRLRWPGIKETKFIGACNPIGEAWVKNYWIKRLYPPEEHETQDFYFIQALPNDNPHLPKEYFESLKSLPDVERKAYLEGNWDAFSDAMDIHGWLRLMSDTDLQNCTIPTALHSGFKVLGVDPAAGGDHSAIVLKSGHAQEILFNQKLRDVMDLVSVTYDMYRSHQAAMIVVDKSGVGQGVFDRLKQMNVPVQGLSFGESPSSPDYANLKAELYWKERQWLLSGGRLVANHGWNEFEIIKYKPQEGKIKIQPKDELFRLNLPSPNCVDAAVLTMAVTDTAIQSSRILKARHGQFYDHMKTVWRA